MVAMTKNIIFKNDKWKVIWKKDYIEIQNMTDKIPSSTPNGATISYNGKIRYWNPEKVPDYIKTIVEKAFKERRS